MKKLLFAAATLIAFAAATPASAQVYVGADPWGAGVQVGPLGVGVGHRYGWREHYRDDCPMVRERIVTPSGRVIIRAHRSCY